MGRPWLAAVLTSGLTRLPKWPAVRLRLKEFCTSAERLAWAKANGCPWGSSYRWNWWDNPCALAARGGHLDALHWARQHGCPWGAATCASAAAGGHLEALQWARQYGCPWNKPMCTLAARGRHLPVLQWARAYGCPWSKWDCEVGSLYHPETQAWETMSRIG